MKRFGVLAGAVVVLVLSGGPLLAQGRGHGRGRENAPGQLKKEDARFGDRDREIARNWYLHEQRSGRQLPPGLRDRDRLPPGIERQLQPGYVLAPEYRSQVYPCPPELIRGFAPPPTGFRFMMIGGRVVLMDAAFRIADAIQVGVSIRP